MLSQRQPIRDVSVCQPTRQCTVCRSVRPLVLFPKTPGIGAYSKVCQVCVTDQHLKDEAMFRAVCFYRHRRVIPLKEKRK